MLTDVEANIVAIAGAAIITVVVAMTWPNILKLSLLGGIWAMQYFGL